MYILAFQNTKEHIAEGWVMLFYGADSRFKLARLIQSASSSLAVIEVSSVG